MKPISATRAVFIGGTIGAALDLTFALSFAAYNGVMPERLLQLIASGLLGKAAIGGGMQVAALGVVLHFLLSYGWAAIFLMGARRMPALVNFPVAAGCAFGIVVFLCMRLIVKPLSAFPFPVNWNPLSSTLDLCSHMFLFGVPIAKAQALARR